MPVSKGRKRKQRKSETRSLSPKTLTRARSTIVARLTAIILGVATLVGVPAAVIAFWPRVTVNPSGLFDDLNAYSVTFTTNNTGFLPFEDVRIGVGLCSIETAKRDLQVTNNCKGDTVNIRITDPSWWTPELKRDEPFSIVLSDKFNVATKKYRTANPNIAGSFQMLTELKAANVIIAVNFKPWPSPWEVERRFRFVAEEQPNEKMMWRAVPLSWQAIKFPN
jgi:hypothetical protein